MALRRVAPGMHRISKPLTVTRADHTAAAQSGMQRQTLRDWVQRRNAQGVEGLKCAGSLMARPA